MKPRYLISLLLGIMFILLLSSCTGNKTKEVVEKPRRPIELAKDAVEEAQEAYDEERHEDAIASFKEAIEQYEFAAPTAAETDSIDVRIEQVKLFMAKIYMDMASESSEMEIHTDAIDQLQEALKVLADIQALTISHTEKEELIKALYRRTAYAQQAAGLYEDALVSYDKELALDPSNEEILNIKYDVLNNYIKDEERAINVLIDYAETSQNYNAYLILGGKYDERGNFAEASKYYELAMAANPSEDVLISVANFYRNNSKWADSNIVLEKLVKAKPDDATLASVYRLIADNYGKIKNNAKMIEYFEKSLTLERNADIALIVTKHYYDAKNYSKTINYATMVINSDPNNAAAYLLRGDSYNKQKKYSDAKADLQRIVNDRTYGETAQKILKTIK